MKRALIQNVKVMPYTLETAIDREGYLSAILAASVTAGTSAKVSVTHCDTESGSYEAVPDDFIVAASAISRSTSPAPPRPPMPSPWATRSRPPFNFRKECSRWPVSMTRRP